MGPFLFLNAALIGFFVFAAIYHLLLWWSSRREPMLGVFGLDCALRAVFTGVMVMIATSTTITQAQRGLHDRISVGILISITWLWTLSLVSGVRSRRFVWTVTAFLLVLFSIHRFGYPVEAHVISVESFELPWGEFISNPRIGRPGWWFGLLYLLPMSVEAFGFYCGRRVWKGDGVGGALIIAATLTLLMLHCAHFLRSIGVIDLPFVGGMGHLLWACIVGLVIARRNTQMREKLVASEQRLRGMFDQTFQFIGLLRTDGTLIEANHSTLEFAGGLNQNEIGKPFWQASWWSHSRELQDRLRSAVSDAASGNTVRFETTRLCANGDLTYIDFSLKPLRDERGNITLLIPEGRDITERKQSEESLQQRVTELTILNRIGIICSESNVMDDMIERVTKVIAGIKPSVNCGFLMLDPDRRVLVAHPSFVSGESPTIRVDQALGIGLAGQVAQSGRPRRIADASTEPGDIPADARTRSQLCLPIRIGSTVMGVLLMESDQACSFTAADEQLFSTAIDMIGNAMERLRAEERLRASEQRFALFMQYLPGLAWIKDAEGRYVYANDNMMKVIQWSRQELYGKTDDEVFPPETAAEFKQNDQRALASGIGVQAIESLEYADGVVHHAIVSKFPLPVPDSSGLLVGGVAFDITERMNAEKDLQRSLSLLRATLESTADGILVVDAADKIVSFNQQFVNLWRIPASVIEARVYSYLLEFVRDQLQNPDMFLTNVRELNAQPESTGFDSLTFNDGRVFESYSHPQRLGNQIVGRVWSFRDVTERQRTAESLQMMRFSVDHASDSIFWVSREGLILYVNDAACSTRGYARDELLGKTVFELDPNYQTGVWERHFEDLKRRGSINLETHHQTKDGHLFPIEVNANYVHIGNNEFNFAFARDITERKQREHRIVQLASIVESSNDAIFSTTLEGTISSWNRGAFDVYSYSEVEMLGRSVSTLIPADRAEEMPEVLAKIGRGEHISDFESVSLGKNDRRIDVLLTISPVWDADGKLVGAATIARDITERKRAEEERSKLEAQNLHAQKLESLGVLAGGIAHDFNNLLTVVLGNAGLSLMFLDEESPAVPMLREIEQAAERAADLTQQMLAYSGKGKFVIETLRLDILVHEMSKLLKAAVSKKATIELNLQPATIDGDATQIRQVVMNLIMNASDALEGNVGSISIRTGVRHVDSADLVSSYLPDVLQSGTYAFIEVEDNGCGMAEETQAKMFEPFFTTKFAGRGLGLAAVLGIVRGHRGMIKTQSAPGRGTEIHVLIPCEIAREAEKIESRVEHVLPQGQGTVLVVEDEVIIQTFVRRVLERAGFQVVAAHDGYEGLSVYQEHARKIVAVLLDLTMPRMDGLEGLHKFREIAPNVPILLMSGYAEQVDTIRQTNGAANGFIQKPFAPRDLIERLVEILADRRP